MAGIQFEDAAESVTEERSIASQTIGSFLMSLAFWLALLMSAFMYTAVSLSPKVADWISVRQQFSMNAVRLNQLEDEADYLEQVAAALKSDPEFVEHLVRAEISPRAEDADIKPASQDLLFRESAGSVQTSEKTIQSATVAIVFHLASDQRHRTWLLFSAAGLTLLAFTLLNDAGSGIAMSIWIAASVSVRSAVGRYRKAAPVVQQLEDDPA